MENNKKFKPPKAASGDVVYAAVKAGISMIPYAGAPASELLGLIVTPPLEKRRSEWMESIGNGLLELEQKMNIVLQDLQDNDKFIDAAMDATQIALRTSEKEKLKALRNALLNSALPNSPDESIRKMFFSFIDIFGVFHIKILELFQNPRKWFVKYGMQYPDPDIFISSSLSNLIERAFPMLKNRRKIYDQIWKDLYLRGLVSTEGLHTMMTAGGIETKRTTGIGDAFLGFISNPIESN
jgi:hypothetical protein